MHWSQFTHFLVTMFAVTNPLGNLAIFISLVANRSQAEQRKIALETAIAVAVTLLLITWAGSYVLSMFGITIAAFQIAGGLIITLIGLSLLSPKQHNYSNTPDDVNDKKAKVNIAVVPMAIPIIGGPGAMTALLVNTHQYQGFINKVYLTGGVIIISLIIFAVLFFSSGIKKLLGIDGIKIASRIMGLVLVAIAFTMIISGMQAAFPGLAG